MFVLNVSSPNTPGLRDLQSSDHLSSVLTACNRIKNRKEERKPILLKLSPDSRDDEISDSISASMKLGIDGIVATNTTIKRPVPINTQSRKAFSNDGGLSGRPLQSRSLEVISKSYTETEGKIPIIGVGGIDSSSLHGKLLPLVPHYCNCILQ